MNPPPVTLIKSKNDEISEKYCVEIKLRRDPTSQKLDPYKSKTTLYDKSNPEELFLFIRNFNMTLEASGMLAGNAKIQYLRTLVHG